MKQALNNAPAPVEVVRQVVGAAEVPFVNFNPGPEYSNDNRYFGICSSITKSPGGRLWCSFVSGGVREGRFNYGLVVTSEDDGHTWSSPRIAFDTPGPDRMRSDHVVCWMSPQDELWLMWNRYPHGLVDSGSSLWAITSYNSDAAHPTWTQPRKLADELNLLNRPTVLADGTWIFPTGNWTMDKPTIPSRPLISTDAGRTFFPGGPLLSNEPNDFDEYMIVEAMDGRLVTLNRHPQSFLQSTSLDKGRTWTKQQPNSLVHTNARFVFMKLHSGNWLLVKHGSLNSVSTHVSSHEPNIGRTHLTAYISTDEGETWSGGLELDERSISYPYGFQDQDGKIYLSYERERFDNPEILLATFREEDATAGKVVSKDVRFKVLVNRATGDKQALLADPANQKFVVD